MRRFQLGTDSNRQKAPPPPYPHDSSSDEDDTPMDEKHREDDADDDERDESPEPPNYTSKSLGSVNPFSDPSSSTAGPSSRSLGPDLYACLALSRSDKIRLIGFPKPIFDIVTSVIEEYWEGGIMEQGAHMDDGYEWKLTGRPWAGAFSAAVPSKRLLLEILDALCSNGWQVVVASALSKREWAKDSIFFKATPPAQRTFLAVAFYRGDKVRLIGHATAEVSRAVNQAVSNWAPGIQEAKEIESNCLQFKLRGRPCWGRDVRAMYHFRVMVCLLLREFQVAGYELVASVDMSHGTGGGEGHSDVDTLFFASGPKTTSESR